MPIGRKVRASLAFFFNDTASTEIYTLSLHDALPIWLWLALYPAMVVQIALEVLRGVHPFAHLGAPAWAAAFLAHFWLLSRHAGDHPRLGQALHSVGVWMIAIVGAREVGWLIDYAVEGKRVWPSIAWALFPAAVLASLSARRVQ